ncbi:LT_GEWL domain containing protein [uncultured Caudovirales phage]|uniref:LT_GEWL domain containing protein n=1 Tax=uncultured Caudovirales phage TaxID=2100421 RepID=A0A6J5NJW0_9CAUD|nr:LT_GEWL domain containing protein [uncultured Caudovirales phage]
MIGRVARLVLVGVALGGCASVGGSGLRDSGLSARGVARIEGDPSKRRVAESVVRHAERHGVPPRLALAVTYAESRFRVDAVGPQTPWGRAYGPMQVLVSTARTVEPGVSAAALRTYEVGPRVGVAYLARGFREQRGDMCRTAMRYHGGPNERMWGPRTRQYCRIVMGAL